MCLRHIAEGEERVGCQLQMVASLAEVGDEGMLATARTLLANLETTVALSREHLRIEQAKQVS